MPKHYTFILDSPLRLHHNKRVTVVADSDKTAKDNVKAIYPSYSHDLVKVS